MDTQSAVRKLFKSPDNWMLAIFSVMAIAFFFDTWHFRAAAALFPRLVSGIVAVLCLYGLGESIWTAVRGKAPARKAKAEGPRAIAWYWVVLTMAAYLALIVVIGFNLATLAFMILFPPLIGFRRWVIIVPFAVIMTAAVAYSFGSILHVQLPIGILGSALGW